MSKLPKAARFELPAEVLRQRYELARSGAPGVHEDQHASKGVAAGRVNRVSTRRAQVRAALNDQFR